VLETGLNLQVPPYLSSGEVIKVDTRDGHFVSRA
jgi:elongation factor P